MLGLASLRSTFRDLRPKVAIVGNAGLWWRFACNAVLRDYRRVNQPWSWKFIAARRDTVGMRSLLMSFCAVLAGAVWRAMNPALA